MASLIENLNHLKDHTPPKLTLSLANELVFVPLQDIIRIEAAGAYSTFFLSDGRHIMVSKNLKEYEMLRSEEHTSELQSLMRHSYAVFCLKKKNKHKLIL